MRLSKTVQSIPPSGIRKFFDLVAEHPNAISLGIGEPDFVTPWAFREEAINSIQRGHTSYTSTLGLIELRRAIAAYFKSRFSVRFDPQSEILITVGASQALDLTLRAITDPGDEIIIIEPNFVAYAPAITLAGGKPVALKTTANDEWRVDPVNLSRLITPRTKAIMINSPGNPTGAALPREDVEAVQDLAQRHRLWVISDEIYAELTYEGEHVCAASIARSKPRTVVISGLSKGWAMTGWRVGFVCGPKGIIDAMSRIHQHTMMCVTTASQWAAVEAFRRGEDDVAAMRESYLGRRNLILAALGRMGLPCVRPHGAFYVFPSIAPTGMTSEQFAQRLLEEESVAVVPGSAFGASGEGHIRCSYATGIERIEAAMERMGRFVKRHRRGKR